MRCLPLALLGLFALGSCAANQDGSSARTPWGKVGRVLAIDFSPRAAQRRIHSFRRVLDLPLDEAERARNLLSHAKAAPAKPIRRVSQLPAQLHRGVRSELARSLAVARPDAALRRMTPSPDRFAQSFARDLERVGQLLGLEWRPLREIDDREHRTDPHDNRPEASLWARLQRRIFP